MRIVYFATICLFGLHSASAEPTFEKGLYKVLGAENEVWKKIQEVVSHSDIAISTNQYGKFDIGITVGDEAGGEQSLWFSVSQLERFFKKQQHKNTITITLSKNDLVSDSLQLSEFFIKMGYGRILILRAHSSGYLVESDRVAK